MSIYKWPGSTVGEIEFSHALSYEAKDRKITFVGGYSSDLDSMVLEYLEGSDPTRFFRFSDIYALFVAGEKDPALLNRTFENLAVSKPNSLYGPRHLLKGVKKALSKDPSGLTDKPIGFPELVGWNQSVMLILSRSEYLSSEEIAIEIERNTIISYL
tara:strand:+ start:3899 stop:4369 length:471 start_codon:yes stop_codon:yes gene_type:complete